MPRKKTLSAALVGMTAAAFIVSTAHAATLSVATSLVRTDKQTTTYMDLYHDPVHKADNGISLNYKGGPEVIPNRKQGAALKRGVIDMHFGPSGYYSGLVPCARVVALAKNNMDTIRSNGGWEVLEKCWKENLNAQIIAHPMKGVTKFHVYLVDKPRTNTKTGLDLSGYTMRSTALYHPFMKAMGARPINISPGDVYTSLQRKLVRGLAWPEGNIFRYGWHEFVKYRVGPGFWRTSSLVIVNLDVFNKLTNKQQNAMKQAGIKFERDSVPHYGKIGAEDTKKLANAGVKLITLKGAEAAAFTDTVYNVTWEAAKKKIPADMFKQLRKTLLE
jgi:TRAP-type C4-dicarboxylate transport system substrate-binding protein